MEKLNTERWDSKIKNHSLSIIVKLFIVLNFAFHGNKCNQFDLLNCCTFILF